MKIPQPRETLAGCFWLPRMVAKARLLKNGELPPEYAARFCHPTGIDAQFLAHFGLGRADIVAAAELSDAGVSDWFLTRTTRERIDQWNHIAANLGRPGYPLAERFPVALETTYKHLAGRGFTTILELIEADEAGA